MQQAFVLWFADDQSTNLKDLNALLNEGWEVVSAFPMSGTGEVRLPQEVRTDYVSPYPFSRSLVIISRKP
jgi:hypothetical protein